MKRRDLYDAWIAAERDDNTIEVRLPDDLVPMLTATYARRRQENFVVVALDGAHQVIKHRAVTKGTLTRTLVHAREVFRFAIVRNAAAIIIAHNHPSGNVEPSPEDDQITRNLVNAGQVVGIPVLDHLVVSTKGYFSYLENDRL